MLVEQMEDLKARHMDDSKLIAYSDDSVNESQEGHNRCKANLDSGTLSSNNNCYLSESEPELLDDPQKSPLPKP